MIEKISKVLGYSLAFIVIAAAGLLGLWLLGFLAAGVQEIWSFVL